MRACTELDDSETEAACRVGTTIPVYVDRVPVRGQAGIGYHIETRMSDKGGKRRALRRACDLEREFKLLYHVTAEAARQRMRELRVAAVVSPDLDAKLAEAAGPNGRVEITEPVRDMINAGKASGDWVSAKDFVLQTYVKRATVTLHKVPGGGLALQPGDLPSCWDGGTESVDVFDLHERGFLVISPGHGLHGQVSVVSMDEIPEFTTTWRTLAGLDGEIVNGELVEHDGDPIEDTEPTTEELIPIYAVDFLGRLFAWLDSLGEARLKCFSGGINDRNAVLGHRLWLRPIPGRD